MLSELLFVRHGATEANLAGLRCGGDLDVPLTTGGREQAAAVARRLKHSGVGVIVTSDLKRTRETARIIAEHLDGVEVVVQASFGERRLGSWNLLPIQATQAALRARHTPPGGEPAHDFSRRIAEALPSLFAQMPRRPLMVGSRGVARVLGELLRQPAGELGNADIARFDLTTLMTPPTESRLP